MSHTVFPVCFCICHQATLPLGHMEPNPGLPDPQCEDHRARAQENSPRLVGRGTGSWPQHVTPGQDWGRKCSLPVLPCWEPSSRVRWGCTESRRSVARPAVHACRGRLGHCLPTSDDAIASCRWIPGFLLCLTPTGPAKEGSPRARVAGAVTPALIIPMLLRQLTVTTPGLRTPWRV